MERTTMQQTIRTHNTRLDAAASFFMRAVASGSTACRTGWHRLVDAFSRCRLALRRQRACEPLDEHTLRDLGLDRSECWSYLAESRGTAERTRLRVAASG
jgi:uncharacterized protein YjiS (DUF1127 family)